VVLIEHFIVILVNFYVIFYQILPIKDNLTLAILLNMVIIIKMDFLHCTYCYFHLFLSFNINNMPKETPRKRKSLTAAQKKEICLKKETTPYLKQKDLAKEYDVSEGMVSDILKEKD
jgi:hypothetical protein